MSDAERLDQLISQLHDRPPEAGVAAVQRFFARREPEKAYRLADERADQVGELDGAPPSLRYRANHLRLVRRRDELRRELRTGDGSGQVPRRLHTLNWMLMPHTELGVDAAGRPVPVERDRQFLSLQMTGDGKVAEVVGDLATAQNVITVVNGIGVSVDDLPAQTDYIRAIRTEAGPGTASVLWMGYDSPDGVGSATSKQTAYDAAADLNRYAAGLNATVQSGTCTTVLGHSYGSVVTANAVLLKARLGNVIFAGSPGLGHDIRSVADLDAPDTRFFAARAPGDVVSYTQWHGPDPADFPDIVRLQTAGGPAVRWHEEYYRPNSESLRNIGRVIRGEYDLITTTNTTVGQETKLAPGISWGGAVRGLSTPVAQAYDGVARLTGVRHPAPTAQAPDAAAAARRVEHRPEGRER